MIRVIRVLSILLALLVANMPTLHAKQKTFTVAFGSCAKHYLPQPIWNDIAKHKPDLFLFIGDNQYADTRFENGRRIYGPVSDPEQFTYAYNAVKQIPEFIFCRFFLLCRRRY